MRLSLLLAFSTLFPAPLSATVVAPRASSPALQDALDAAPQASLPAASSISAKPADAPAPPPAAKAEGIGLSHSGNPFDIPYFTLDQIAELLRKAGGTHYRPHLPLNEAHPVLSPDDVARLDLAAKDPVLLDSMIDDLSRNGRWDRIDSLVDAFESRGIRLILVVGAGYRKEAPMLAAPDGTQVRVSPDRLGRERYLTMAQWFVGAAVRRYASRVRYWQAENEINLAHLVTALGWRVKDDAWTDVNFRQRLVAAIAHTVHAEGKRQGLQLQTTHNFAADIPWTNFIGGATHLAGAIRTYALNAELDIIGVDLYANRFVGRPFLIQLMAHDVEVAAHAAGNRPVWVLETGFPNGPSQFDFNDGRQAEYFRKTFDACYGAGAKVVLAFGWFWNPHGWYTDNPKPLPWYDPMAAEQYWSPVHVTTGSDGQKTVTFGGAWDSFQDAARKWISAPAGR